MSGHTPGPWAISRHPERVDIVSQSGNVVAVLRTFGSYTPEDERGPNAALIAAAPELAEALEAWVRHDSVPALERDLKWSLAHRVIHEQARAALRNAGRLE